MTFTPLRKFTTIRDIDPGAWFDMAMRSAEGCRQDARLVQGKRRDLRIARALRFEAIAERMVRDA